MKRCARQVPHAAVHFRKAAASITLCAALALTACSSSDRKGEAADDSPSRAAQAPTSSAPANPKETVSPFQPRRRARMSVAHEVPACVGVELIGVPKPHGAGRLFSSG